MRMSGVGRGWRDSQGPGHVGFVGHVRTLDFILCMLVICETITEAFGAAE